MRRITVRVPDELFLKLTVLSALEKRSKEELVVEAIEEYLEKRKDEIKLP